MSIFWTTNAPLMIFLVPLVAFAILGLSLLFRQYWDELIVYRFARGSLYLSLLFVLFTAFQFFQGGAKTIFLNLGDWFHVGSHHFALQFQFDYLSLVYCFLVATLSIVTSKFSSTYLLGERGYHRFFLLLLLFNTGNMFIVMAGNIDLLLVGWEWVGLCSVLLISFFSNRNIPVKNSLYAFISYRICDVGLLTAVVLFHEVFRDPVFSQIFSGTNWPDLALTPSAQQSTGIYLIGLSLIFASLAKSSQFPFNGWLSKAMEGPTPSSAIFYGGISIHLGCFLLLRCSPFIHSSLTLQILLFLIGAITAVYGAMVGRTRADTKTTLAFASMSQVGIIMMEIALGLKVVALIHIFSHAVIRTFQFLRASSLMQDFLSNPLIYENSVMGQGGNQYQSFLGQKLFRWFYYFSLDSFYLDTIVTRFVVSPIIAISETLNRWEKRYCGMKLGDDEDLELKGEGK